MIDEQAFREIETEEVRRRNWRRALRAAKAYNGRDKEMLELPEIGAKAIITPFQACIGSEACKSICDLAAKALPRI